MATTKKLLQHSSHVHPLKHLDSSCELFFLPSCELCCQKVFTKAYSCRECDSYYHKVCAEAPPWIDCHPLHRYHPLLLIHLGQPFNCDACGKTSGFNCHSFSWDECDFDLDIGCAVSCLPDQRGSQGSTPEYITLPLHRHPLTLFPTGHKCNVKSDCAICLKCVKGDGYICLNRRCTFFIHKECIRDPYFADGIKAPQVYHDHQLETFVGEDTGSSRCANCGFDRSGKFINWAVCKVFILRECIQAPEIF